MVEIIVVDDASEPPLCDEDWDAANRCRRCASRQGVAAPNLGASLARGRVLLFLDADVCFSDNIFAELRSSGVANGCGIRGCASNCWVIAPFSRTCRRSRTAPAHFRRVLRLAGLRLNPDPDVTVNRSRPRSTPFCVPYVGGLRPSRQPLALLRLGWLRRGLTGFGSLEDAELAMRCWSFGKDVQVIPAAVCYHFSEPRGPGTPRLLIRATRAIIRITRIILQRAPRSVFPFSRRIVRRDPVAAEPWTSAGWIALDRLSLSAGGTQARGIGLTCSGCEIGNGSWSA